MRTIKKVASHIFIDGFGGMTQGLFATLIIGTMIQHRSCSIKSKKYRIL